MKRLALVIMAAGTLAAVVFAFAGGGKPPAPSFPEGYRTWIHVKSMVILPGHPLEDPFEGIHHVYANPAALEGLKGGTWRDGAVLVFDLLEAVRAKDAITEGGRKLIGVMVRDAKLYRATGGWGFEAFAAGDPARRLVTDGGRGCYDCHTGAEGLVFSRWRP